MAAITAVAVWLWSEFDGANAPHPNDLTLFQNFLATITTHERRQLRDQDMGAYFPINLFNGSDQVVRVWHGPSHEFLDPSLARKWSEASKLLTDFIEKVGVYTGAAPNASNMATVKTTQDFATGSRSPLTIARAEELNAAGTAAADALDEFERLARRRLWV